MNRFYVYVFLREDRYTPYYVGKGTGHRCYSKQRLIQPPKDKSRIVIIKDNLLECQSFELERKLIEFWGRIDIGTGVLHNRLDGGLGGVGMSQDQRDEISRRMMGNTYSKGLIPPNKGVPCSEEQKKKQSDKMKGRYKGRVITEEHRRKLKESARRRWERERTKSQEG